MIKQIKPIEQGSIWIGDKISLHFYRGKLSTISLFNFEGEGVKIRHTSHNKKTKEIVL